MDWPCGLEGSTDSEIEMLARYKATQSPADSLNDLRTGGVAFESEHLCSLVMHGEVCMRNVGVVVVTYARNSEMRCQHVHSLPIRTLGFFIKNL